jgi:NADPH-dependent stearoyl-CoA 9-desaturase
MNTKSKTLTKEEIEQFGSELEEIRKDILSKVGQEDADHIRRVYNSARYNEIMGRLLIHFSMDPVSLLLGSSLLGLSKIINNMELGHNVMHGQYDWMNDPKFNSSTFEWDHACDSSQWKFYHNYMHHTFTNIIGKDHDFGYNYTRLSKEQPWRIEHLFQTVSNLFMSFNFEWGVAGHGFVVEYVEKSKNSVEEKPLHEYRDVFLKKAEKQLFKDYILFPLLGGFMAPKIFIGNYLANTMRNLWTYAIIYCGHFTENTETFSQEECKDETKADWYLRQLKGSSNLEGSKTFYWLSGHLSHQIEHHMFPDIPANRYEEIAPRLQEVCKKYGQFYNNGSFLKQFASVWKRIFTFSFPELNAKKLLPAA